jgi:serine/threonine-protein kinase
MSRDLIGVTLGKYRCVEFIGFGGMAEVYRAVDTELDRVVALKVLHPFLVTEDGLMERFRREARTLASLRHPSIVEIYDSGLEGFNSYVVMEYVPGPTLKDRLRELNERGEKMPIPEIRRIFDALFAALRYAHSVGIAHRDLKPNNVILANDGRVVLADFGLAKIIGSPIQTASMTMIGTPAYMAPEQSQRSVVDERSDLYSLGAILFELLTGQLPFRAETPFEMITKHAQEALPRASQLRRDVPRGLDRVLFKAMAKDPVERFQTVDQFATALNAAFDGRRLPLALMRPRISRATRNWIALAAAGLIMVFGIGTANGWFGGAVPTETPAASPTPSPTATRILSARIIRRTVLLEQPDPLSAVVGQLDGGTEVALLDQNGSWWKIRALNNGVAGWVTQEFLVFVLPTPTPTLTNTPPPGASLTPVPTTTATPRPSVSPSATPTLTPTPTSTSADGLPASTQPPLSNTPQPTLTATPKPSPTTPTLTRTPISPTATSLPPATPKPLPTDTPVPSPTPTEAPTETPMPLPTATNTPVPTARPTNTYTPVPTLRLTPSPTLRVWPVPTATSTSPSASAR